MAMEVTDRRCEPRFPVSGVVELTVVDLAPRRFTANLLDRSRHGFRVAYECAGLHSGQEVRFEHSFGKGRAKVMWTRIVGDQAESGFLIL